MSFYEIEIPSAPDQLDRSRFYAQQATRAAKLADKMRIEMERAERWLTAALVCLFFETALLVYVLWTVAS